MPIYEYVCEKCGHEFDKIQKMDEKPLVKCPQCKKRSLQKKISAGGFILKGYGWHRPGHSSG